MLPNLSNRRLMQALLSVTAFFFSTSAAAVPSYLTFPSDVDWQTQSSPHFQIIFRKGQDRFGARALLAAEHAWNTLTPYFPEVPPKTYIVLADFQDSTNGYALTFPYPHFVIFGAPPDAGGQLSSLDDWLPSVVLHEFVHILHVYPANAFWRTLRSVFGSMISPNGLAPSHFHEGLAVLLETEKTKAGRGTSPMFNAYRRMAVEDGAWGTSAFFTIDQMDGAPTRWPQGTSAYFFGYTLYAELWKRKGPQGIKDLVFEYSRNWPLLLGGPLKTVYGIDYFQLWKEIFAKTKVTSQQENDKIKQEGLSPLRYLTDTRQGKSDFTLSPDKTRFAIRRWTPETGATIDLHALPSLERLDTLDVTGGGNGICWVKRPNGERNGEPDSEEVLLYLDGESRERYLFHVLRGYSPRTKSSTKITADGALLAHLHSIACSADGEKVALYDEVGGVGQVIEISRSEHRWRNHRSWQIPEGTWISGIYYVGNDIRFFLRRRTLTESYLWETGAPPKLVASIPGDAFSPRMGVSQHETVAIADLDGRYELWNFDWSKGQALKWVSLLGGASSFDSDGNRFYLTAYRHGGYDLASATAEKPTAGKAVKLGAPASASREAPVTVTLPTSAEMGLSSVGSYSPLETLVPRTWLPSMLVVPDGLQVGFFLPSFDLSQKHFAQLFGGYDTRGLPFGDLSYTYRFAKNYQVAAELYYVPSYLAVAKLFFQRWGGAISFSANIHPDLPSLQIGPVFRRLEPTPGINSENQSVGIQIGLSYGVGFKRNPLSISSLRGTRLAISHSQFLKAAGSTDNYFSTVIAAEQYLEAPWLAEHVFFAGAKLGYTEGTFVLANYFDAGGEVLFSQGRSQFLNRGFLPSTFFGRRIFNFNLEYRFPILQVYRGLELMPFYLKTVWAAVVADGTSLDFGPQSSYAQNLFKTFYYSVGAELRSDWQLGFYLPSHIRLGAYHGFGPFGQPFYFVLGFEATI